MSLSPVLADINLRFQDPVREGSINILYYSSKTSRTRNGLYLTRYVKQVSQSLRNDKLILQNSIFLLEMQSKRTLNSTTGTVEL
jgi:hypothetical protein